MNKNRAYRFVPSIAGEMMQEDIPLWPFVLRNNIPPSSSSSSQGVGLDPVEALKLCQGQKLAQDIVIKNQRSEIVALMDDRYLSEYRNKTLEHYRIQSDEKCNAYIELMAAHTSQHESVLRRMREKHDALESEVEHLRSEVGKQKERRRGYKQTNRAYARTIASLREEVRRRRRRDPAAAAPPPAKVVVATPEPRPPAQSQVRDAISVRTMIVPSPAVSLGRI